MLAVTATRLLSLDRAFEFAGMSTIPRDMRTGVLDQNQNRPAVGTHTFSATSVESLAFQLGIILAIAAGAYGG